MKEPDHNHDGRYMKWYWILAIIVLEFHSCADMAKMVEIKNRVEVLEKNQKAESGK